MSPFYSEMKMNTEMYYLLCQWSVDVDVEVSPPTSFMKLKAKALLAKLILASSRASTL